MDNVAWNFLRNWRKKNKHIEEGSIRGERFLERFSYLKFCVLINVTIFDYWAFVKDAPLWGETATEIWDIKNFLSFLVYKGDFWQSLKGNKAKVIFSSKRQTTLSSHLALCADSFTQGTQLALEAKPLSLNQSRCLVERRQDLGKTSVWMGTRTLFARPRVSLSPP